MVVCSISKAQNTYQNVIGNGYIPGLIEHFASDAIQRPDKSSLIVSVKETDNYERHIVLTKVDSNGIVLFQNVLMSITSISVYFDVFKIINTSDGGNLIIIDEDAGNTKTALIKLNSSHSISWIRQNISLNFKGFDVVETSNGFVLAGTKNSSPCLVFVNQLGNFQSENIYNTFNGVFYSISKVGISDFIFSGSVSTPQNTLGDFFYGYINTQLQIVWHITYNISSYPAKANSCLVLNNGNFCFSGTLYNNTYGTYHSYIVCTSSAGNIIWDKLSTNKGFDFSYVPIPFYNDSYMYYGIYPTSIQETSTGQLFWGYCASDILDTNIVSNWDFYGRIEELDISNGQTLNFKNLGFGLHNVFFRSIKYTSDNYILALLNFISYSPIIVKISTNLEFECANECIWPGDVNRDGIVNNIDIIPIGIHFNTLGGNIRLNRDNVENDYWGERQGLAWNNTSIWGHDLMHVDCDGDGSIDFGDVSYLFANYNQTHQRSRSFNYSVIDTINGIILSVDTNNISYNNNYYSIPVLLGSSTNPANNIYAVIFSAEVTSTIGPNPEIVSIPVPNTYWGQPTLGTSYVYVSHSFLNSNKADAGITRTNQQDTTTYGLIANITFHDVNRSNADQYHINLFDIAIVDKQGNVKSVNPQNGSITPSNIKVNIAENNMFNVYPNPFNSSLEIKSTTNNFIDEIQIYDISGKLLFQEYYNNKEHIKLTMLEGFERGIYFAKIISTQNNALFKIVKN